MKKKTLFKALGVGALALTGMFAFTGCDSNLSENQTKTVMDTVEMAETYMKNDLNNAKYENQLLKEKNELLQQQNEALSELAEQQNENNETLKEKNDILQEKNELLQQQNEVLRKIAEQKQDENYEILKEKVYNMVSIECIKFINNIDGARDNILILGTSASRPDEVAETKFYNSSNLGYMIASDNFDGYETLFYTKEDKNYIYKSKDYLSSEPFTQRFFNQEYYEDEIKWNVEQMLFCYQEINLEDIEHVEVKDNGNYVLYDIDLEYADRYYSVEITPTGKFVKEVWRNEINPTMVLEYNYDVLTDADFDSIIEKAENADLVGGYIDASGVRISSTTQGSSDRIADLITEFNLVCKYYEDGELITKTYTSYEEFTSDGGMVQDFSTSTTGQKECTFGFSAQRRIEEATVSYYVGPAVS